ncbi:MAG: RelA/SpoT family protein [Candidatus Moranbacteria bacterium]|nr:RelA/SpoT family protein [Candidatus Moranbacteria bacterium]
MENVKKKPADLATIIKQAKKRNMDLDERFLAKVFNFAEKAHQGQKRASGEPYINHPMEAALILAKLGLGEITIAGAILHDVPEDTNYTLKDIEKNFGKKIAFIVSGISHLGKIKLRDKQKHYNLENLRKMFLVMASDIRTVIIKLADRYHNMQTLWAKQPQKQQRIAKETLEIYAPIANRLGMGELKGDLEDLAFKYVYPDKYEGFLKITKDKYKQYQAISKKSIQEIEKMLKLQKVPFMDIHGRTKHLYRLYLKLKKYQMNLDKIYDVVAVRIIVKNVRQCYRMLGIIHQHYRPMIGRIKDYIALPKPNGYRSLHTTIFGPAGKLIEVQIRSKEMHEESEMGIAAHWLYTEKGKKTEANLEKRQADSLNKELNWVKQLRNWQKYVGRDSKQFFRSLRIDFFKDRIFACTPAGEVIDLPQGATPIDFAYAIHTEVGNAMIAARVNEKKVALNHKIRNGEMVEIITQKGKTKPSEEWLEHAKTGMATVKIKQSLKKSKKINWLVAKKTNGVKS